MNDEEKNKEVEIVEESTNTPPVENPVAEPTEPTENMIPQKRFNQVIAKNKALAAELEELKNAKTQEAEGAKTLEQRIEELTSTVGVLQEQLSTKEQALVRNEVISETGLDPVWVNRLQGTTKEELLEDAKTILETLPKQTSNVNVDNVSTPSNAKPVITEERKRVMAQHYGVQLGE